MFGAADICAWVNEAHDRARGLGGDVRAAAGYFTSLRLDIPFEIVPPGFPQPVVPRPSHRETPKTSPSPLLSRMSRRRSAALRLAAAGRWGRRHRRGRGVAAGGVRPGGMGEKGRLFFLSIERHIAAQQHGERLQRSVALHQRPQIGQCGRNVG